jgi:hypothetical protein
MTKPLISGAFLLFWLADSGTDEHRGAKHLTGIKAGIIKKTAPFSCARTMLPAVTQT